MSTTTLNRGTFKSSFWTLPTIFIELLIVVVLTFMGWAAWRVAARPITVVVDGVEETVYTRRHVVQDLLPDLGLTLEPQDRVQPSLDSVLESSMLVTIQRARPVRILVDGRDINSASWGGTAGQVLADAGIVVDPYDEILVDGIRIPHDVPLPEAAVDVEQATYGRRYGWHRLQLTPIQLRVHRAIPITVDEGGLPFTVRTTAQTVGEALRQARITIYLGDRVQPGLGNQVSTGMRVFIQRSTPISLRVDERFLKTRTRANTVADALTELKIGLSGMDRVTPALEQPLYDNIKIDVTRVWEDVEIEEQIEPFETIFEPDANLLIDTRQIVNNGAEGIVRTRYRVRYEDGEQISRVLEDTWVAQEPTQRVIAYGQRIVANNATVEGQEITYWRKIRMRASSYSASTAGVSPDAPWYGTTYTGDPMRFGIVAVDPRVIPLRTRVYVPGYGYGDALDMGSAIRAKRIDLGYDDDNLVLWSQWADVYLLWPPPPEYQITWVLPNWPAE